MQMLAMQVIDYVAQTTGYLYMTIELGNILNQTTD